MSLNWTDVQSSTCSQYAVEQTDEETSNVFVRFNNGRIYLYRGLSPLDVEEWITASSFGTHLNRVIKPRFIGVETTDAG